MSIVPIEILPTMKLRIIRFLLWLIRRFGYAINTPETLGVYRWVQSPSGASDHWFHTPNRIRSIAQTLKQFGFWPVVRTILCNSEMLTGGRRWVHEELVRLRSEQHFGESPLRDNFAAHALERFLAADPKGDVLAQTAAAYRVADAMMAARLRISHEPTRKHPQRRRHIQTSPTRSRFSGDTMKQTIDGLRQLLSLWLLQLAIAVLPKDRKQELVTHVRSYIQEQISKDTI